jgi:hypothetical protein
VSPTHTLNNIKDVKEEQDGTQDGTQENEFDGWIMGQIRSNPKITTEAMKHFYLVRENFRLKPKT